MPHQTQRTLSLLREQDSLGRECEDTMITSINEFINKYENSSQRPSQEELDKLESGFKGCIFLSEERASLAQQMSLNVKDHLGKLEDDICSFEEEIRLARFHGEGDVSDEDDDTGNGNGSDSDSGIDNSNENGSDNNDVKDGKNRKEKESKSTVEGGPSRKSKRRN